MRALLCLIGCAIAIPTATVSAQSAADFSALPVNVGEHALDFSHLPIKAGDKIYVTEAATGVEVSGPVKTITPGALALNGYSFTPESTLKIERPGDPLWDGALIGWGVGALLGSTVGAEACLHRAQWHCVVEGGVTYALFGIVIDFAHKGRRTIYKGAPNERRKAVHLVPEIGPDRKTVAIAVGF
jgi:hypothetical protein